MGLMCRSGVDVFAEDLIKMGKKIGKSYFYSGHALSFFLYLAAVIFLGLGALFLFFAIVLYCSAFNGMQPFVHVRDFESCYMTRFMI